MIKVVLVSRYGYRRDPISMPQVPSRGEEIVFSSEVDEFTEIETVERVRWFMPNELVEGVIIPTGEVWAEVFLK